MLYTLCSRVSLWQLFLVLVLYTVQANDVPLCSEQESVDITNGKIFKTGIVEFKGVRYNPSQYFQNGSVRRGCICLVRQCIYVCEAQDLVSIGLTELYANVSDASGGSHSRVNLATDAKYHLILRKPQCATNWFAPEQHQLKITSKGELNLNGYIINYPKFCMLPKNEMGEFHAFYCEPESISDLPHVMYAIGPLVSLPFLVGTFVVYAILPELQTVSGKSLMCYVAALAVSYLLLALAHFDVYDYQSVMCMVSAHALYFTLMASFFWLNVMSFDVWTFSGSRGRMTGRRKFLYYSLYAWGTPLLFLTLILLFDHTELISYNLRPNVGEEGCFLKPKKMIEFLYLYLPLLLLISANVVLYAITANRIYQSDHIDASAVNDDSGRHSKRAKDRNRFSLYLRLFLIMGVTWSLELISWLMADPKTTSWLLKATVYLLDVCNRLVGIFIFFQFVWKQRVLKLIRQRFGCKEPTYSEEYTVHTCTESADLDNPEGVFKMPQSQ